MGKSLKYGEFEFPNGGVTYVKGYARGGKVSQAKVSKVMHEFGEGKLHSGSKQGPVVQNRKQAIAIGISEAKKGKGMAAGGPVKLPEKPNIKPDLAPKPPDRSKKPLLGEQMGQPQKNFLGIDSRKYAKGGMVHPDLQEDKALIKRAFGMHDTQRHEGKPTDLSKLRRGGLAYAAGGQVGQKPAAVMKPRGGAKMTGPRGGQQGSFGPPPSLKVGGSVRKATMSLNPKSNVDSPPRSVNVKARMALGAAGSPENLAHGGKVRKK